MWTEALRHVHGPYFQSSTSPSVNQIPVDPAPFLQALRDQLSDPSPSDVDPLDEAFTLMVELLVQRQANSLHLGAYHTTDTTRTAACLRSRTDGLLRLECELDRRLLAPLVEIPWSSSLSLYSLGNNRNYGTALRTTLRSEPETSLE